MGTLSEVPIGRLRDHAVGHGISALTLDEVIDLTGLSRSAATRRCGAPELPGSSLRPRPGSTSRSLRSTPRGVSFLRWTSSTS